MLIQYSETCGIWFDGLSSTCEEGMREIENTPDWPQSQRIRRGSRHSDPFRFVKLTMPGDGLEVVDSSQVTCG